MILNVSEKHFPFPSSCITFGVIGARLSTRLPLAAWLLSTTTKKEKTNVSIAIWQRNLTSERVKYPVTYRSSRKNEPPRLPAGRGSKYQPGNRLLHNTAVLSIEGGPVCSLLFHLGFYRSSSSTSLTATWGASCSAMFYTSSLTFAGKGTWMVSFLYSQLQSGLSIDFSKKDDDFQFE